MAKIVSASTATVVAWLGNRYWSFRHRRQSSRGREFLTFVLMNVIAMVIAVLCLAVSHDLLGFDLQAGGQHLRQPDRHRARHAVPLLGLPDVRLHRVHRPRGRDRAAADAALELPAAAEDLTPAQGIPRVVVVPESQRRAAG
jgi:hypothetical protein